MHELAKKNLEMFGLADRVDFKLRDISEGFDETGVDALFLDVANPYDFIPQVKRALKPGGFFGTILPTVNQVVRVLTELKAEKFAFIDTCEVLLRFYKSEPARFRPTDRMVAHTGFLVFARPVNLSEAIDGKLLEEAGIELGEEETEDEALDL